MGALPYAVHRTIFVVDVENFGDRSRTGPDQLAVRDGLYRALRWSFGRAGVPWQGCHHEDRGDGVLILIPPQVPKDLLAAHVPVHLAAALAEHNAVCNQNARIRLRAVMHAGEVRLDDYGVTGTAINVAFRLLESAALRSALAGSPGVLAVMASKWFFEEVVRHNPASRPGAFRPVAVSVKETWVTAWVCLRDGSDTGQPIPLLTAPWRDPAAKGASRAAFRRGVAVTASVAFLASGVVSGILLNTSRSPVAVASSNRTRIFVAAPGSGCGSVAEDGFRSPATTAFKDIQTLYTVSLDGRQVSVMQGIYDGVAYEWLKSDTTGERSGMQLRWSNSPESWYYCTAGIEGGPISALPAQVATMAVPVVVRGREVTFQGCVWHQQPFAAQCSSLL